VKHRDGSSREWYPNAAAMKTRGAAMVQLHRRAIKRRASAAAKQNRLRTLAIVTYRTGEFLWTDRAAVW
jgi:hypothetical protein